MRFLVTGATGFVGRHLVARLVDEGHHVSVLSRDPQKARTRVPSQVDVHPWRLGEGVPLAAVDGVDAVVHLAGEPVAGRWTKAKRRAIHMSRVQSTKELVEAIGGAQRRPAVLVSASAIGYYGVRGDEELSEESGAGNDFLATVCLDWEKEANVAKKHGVRTVVLRSGIVLGTDGGALPRLLLPAKLGLGGPLGPGKQWWSWIHIDDLVRLIEYVVHHDVSGPLNATAPTPVRQKEFAATLGRVLKRPAFLPAPAVALKAVLGGFSIELLGSKRVLPIRALSFGFEFRFVDLEAALNDLLKR